MRRSISFLVGAVLVCACEGKPLEKVASQRAIQGVGTAAPALVGKTPAGEPFDLAELRGTVVLVNVWATWCAPCRPRALPLQAGLA